MTAALLVAAAAFLVLLPGAVASWRLAAADPRVDLPARLAMLYAGVGLCAWGAWVATGIAGTGRAPLVAVTLLVAGVLLASSPGGRRGREIARGQTAAGRRSRERAGERAAARRRNLEGAGGRAATRRTALRLAGVGVLLALLVGASFLTWGVVDEAGVHRMAMTDWYKHLVVTVGLDSAGAFPPPNPFLRADPDPAYYFGFHLVASSIGRLAGGGDPLAVLLGLTLLTALATPFVVYAWARDLVARPTAVLAAAGASLLAGFDVVVLVIDAGRAAVAGWPLPGGVAGLRAVIPSTHLDYWVHHNERQLSGLYLTTAWAPQHTAGVLLALLILVLLAPRGSGEASREPRSGPLLPALLLASLPAVSAYVAVGLVVAMAGALATTSVAARRPPWSTGAWRRWRSAGLLGALLALPVAGVLAGGGGETGLRLGVSGAGDWSNGAVFTWLFGEAAWARLLDTPAVLLVELGIIGLLAALEAGRAWRGRALDEGDDGPDADGPDADGPDADGPDADGPDANGAGAAGADGERAVVCRRETLAMVATILLLVTFVRPPVDGPNNLYARPMVLVVCLLSPLAAAGLRRRGRRPWIVAGVLVGALGTLYGLAGVLLEGRLFWATPPPTVEAAEWINSATPRDDPVAIHPDDWSSPFGYFLRRPLVQADERHARLLGATRAQFVASRQGLEAAWASADPPEAWRRFAEMGAATILVRDGPPAWARPPCFDVAWSGRRWTVVRPTDDGC